ncbi:MAG: hypothetical protein ACWGOY_08445 [Anaerolineales bacterium]
MAENPLFKKLRYLPNKKIFVMHAPDGFLASFGPLPPGSSMDTAIDGQYDLIHAFFKHTEALENQVEAIKVALLENGILWISYPKQSAKEDTDLNRDILRESMAARGIKAVSQVSINAVWPALRLKRL